MKAPAFGYAKARSVAHAIELMAGDDARVLAGGQSLVPLLNMRLSRPRLIVDINGIPGLDRIEREDGMLRIGALVRHAQAERASKIAQHAPLIAAALPHIGHPAIRNRGTIGGSIALADPAAELPACLVALGADIEAVGPDGVRTIAAGDFFKGVFETALEPGELLTAIRLAAARAEDRVAFAEFARRHGDYAIVGVAGCARAGREGREVRLAFFGVGITPVRPHAAERALSAGDVGAAVSALQDDLDPPGDLQASGAVKRHLAGVLLRRIAPALIGTAS